MSTSFAKSQINMLSNGTVGIGALPSSSYFLQVTGTSGYSGLTVSAPSGVSTGSVYGLFSTVTNSTNGSINRGLYGSVYSSTAAESGQAYGVYGIAGNCTNGYNFGVFGQLLGTNSGASIFGTIGNFFNPPADLINPNVQYAGYFVGKVKITGSIWAASGTITGSDERIKKEISELDSSENIFNLKPKKYKLKNTQELLSSFKITSDTARVAIDTTPILEENTKLHYGFLAQDLQQVYPDLVYTSPDGTLGIDYQGLIPIIIDQLQKMKQSIDEKDTRILALENAMEQCCSLSSLKSASINNNNASLTLPEIATLSQNAPNPFNTTTTIKFYIPEIVQNATIYIYDMNGQQIKSYSISKRGNDSIIINGYELKPGMYLYTLIADGKEVNTKRMILTE